MSTSDYIGPEMPMMWSSQRVMGPVWVRFHAPGGDAVYVDVTKILVIRQWLDGSRIVLQGDVLCELEETAEEVMTRLKEVNKELSL